MIIRIHDALGSVTGMVYKEGKLMGIYDYAAFGQLRRDSLKMENPVVNQASGELIQEEAYLRLLVMVFFWPILQHIVRLLIGQRVCGLYVYVQGPGGPSD